MRCDENGFTDATQGAQWDEQRGARAAGAVAGDDHAVGDDGTDVHGAVPLPLGGGGVHDGQDSVAELWLAVRACTSRSKAGCHTDVGAFAIAAATKTVPQERRRRESAPWDIGLRSHREGGGGALQVAWTCGTQKGTGALQETALDSGPFSRVG